MPVAEYGFLFGEAVVCTNIVAQSVLFSFEVNVGMQGLSFLSNLKTKQFPKSCKNENLYCLSTICWHKETFRWILTLYQYRGANA